MTLTTTAPNRRILAQAIAQHTSVEPIYMGPPTYAYRIGKIMIDRDGWVEIPDTQAADVKAYLIERGWVEPDPEPELPMIRIAVPVKDMSIQAMTNLIHMLYSRQILIGKAVGRQCISIEGTVIARLDEYMPESMEAFGMLLDDFRSLDEIEGIKLDGEGLWLDFPLPEGNDATIYELLVERMIALAKKSHRVKIHKYEPENEKYFMRGWLLQMGLGGKEYKAVREALMKNLSGCTAFPDGERAQKHRDRWNEIRRQHRAEREERDDD